MATAAKGNSALVESAPKKEVAVEVSAPSRREFMYYIWGASMVLLLGQAGAGLIWFALPRFKEGEFGGIFRIPGADLPELGDAPLNQPAGRFWLSMTDTGFMTLYGVCTHLGCLPKWQDSNGRFECPCHGSKYEINGKWIEGPAPRGLDRFKTTITFSNGDVVSTPSDGGPIPLNGREIVSVAVDTGDKIRGPGH